VSLGYVFLSSRPVTHKPLANTFGVTSQVLLTDCLSTDEILRLAVGSYMLAAPGVVAMRLDLLLIKPTCRGQVTRGPIAVSRRKP
jgi:hypothetical protein